jgi:alkylated DNA repair dioxygenase AlkB
MNTELKYVGYWPGYITNVDEVEEDLYESLDQLCQTFPLKVMGKTHESKRKCCLFLTMITVAAVVTGTSPNVETKSQLFTYSDVPHYDWSACAIVLFLKDRLEEELGIKIKYCLINLYRNGSDYIGYHSDKEAGTDGHVVSISWGATRKFRFQKSGYLKEFLLKSGDLVIMYPGCQQQYKHGIPVEKRVGGWRISMTFRE